MALQLRRGTNAERLLITPQQGELIFVTDYLAVNITANTIASNLITFSANHNLIVGQKLLFVGITANGLIQNTVYYVLADGLTTTACKLSLTSAGAPVTLTNATGLTALFNKSPTNATGTPVGNVSPLWVGNGTTVGGVAAQTSVLDDLLDVTISSVAEGQTIYYDANTAQWKNTDILKINDATTGVEIYNTAGTRTRRTVTSLNTAQTVLTVSAASTGTVTAGFGSAIALENEVRPNVYQVGAFITNEVRDTTATNEDTRLHFQVLTAGNYTTPLLLEGYDAAVSGNLILNGINTTDTYISFVHPTKTGTLAWQGTGLAINGDFDVAGTGANGVANITAGNGTTMGIANLFNNTGIGTLNIGYGASTEVNIGGVGTRTQIKSPATELLGTLKVAGNQIKNSDGDSVITFDINDEVEFLSAIQIKGNLIRNSTGNDTITMGTGSEGLVTLSGDLLVKGNEIKSGASGYPTAITLDNKNVIVAGDLAVNGDNTDNAWATISTTKTNAELFVTNATNVNIGYAATSLNMGATTGTTTIRNNAVITGDATVNGGNINLNGTATTASQPFLTFQTQAQGANSQYGVRGKSALDDAWFIGSGSTGTDSGYLEIATGDNVGGTNPTYSGGQIYVRQYSGADLGGVPWEGGNGVIVNELTLLDNIGNTSIPNNLTVGNDIAVNGEGGVWADITTTKNQAQLFPANALTVNLATASTALTLGASSGSTTVRNNLTVSGDLTVNGTTTTVNSTTLTVDDKNIELGSVASPTDSTASGGGITLRGATDKTIIWNNATDGWDFNQNITGSGTLALDGNYITLRNNSTGTPASGDNAYLYVKRGDTGNPAYLAWFENNDTWFFNNNLEVGSNLTVNGNGTIGGIFLGKNALGDSDSTQLSVAKGADLTLQSGSSLILTSDFTALKRNTSKATAITSNTISSFNGGAHQFNINDRIQYLGESGNGLTQNAFYYVVSTGFTTSSCRLATTLNGTPITLTSGTALNLTFFSEGGINNAYFNTQSGQYSFNRVDNSGYYNLEVAGSFNATTNAVIGGDLEVNSGNINTLASTGSLFNYSVPTVYIGGGATYVGIGSASGNTVVGNELTVTGNKIRASGGATALTLTPISGNVAVAGNLTVTGGDISTSASTGALFNSATSTVYIGGQSTYVGIGASTGNTVVNNNLTVGGNKINASNGTTAIELTTSGDIIVTDDIFVKSNILQLNYGTTGTPTLGAAVQVERGDSANVELGWSENTDRWVFTNDGTNYTNIPVASDTPTYAGLSISNNTTDTLVGITGVVANTANDGDAWFVGGYSIGGATNSGAMVIATANNGNEPIYVRQYTGSSFTNVGSNTINKELTLLNSNGDTILAGDLTVTGNTIKKSGGTDVITFSGTNLTTLAGGAVVTADLAVNGGNITTTDTSANLFTTNATAIAIGSSSATTTIAGTLIAGSVQTGSTTDVTTTYTVTQTTPVTATQTTRRGMKILLNITDNVTKDVHMVEALVTTKVVGSVGTVCMTTFGEVTSAGHLATFSADYISGTVYFYVTPLSSNSTQIVCARKSIS